MDTSWKSDPLRLDGGPTMSSSAPSPSSPSPSSTATGHHRVNNNNSSVCRDFMRNVCSRGNKCKFRHPPQPPQPPSSTLGQSNAAAVADSASAEATQDQYVQQHQADKIGAWVTTSSSSLAPPATSSSSPCVPAPPSSELQDSIVFCHDFQNLTCHRGNCRFLHCSRQEEEEFRGSGYLPPHLRDQVRNCT